MTQRLEPAVQTFLFADLSGFTALTEAHGAGCWPPIRPGRSRPSGMR
jgi:class 3 adenylate cyclase